MSTPTGVPSCHSHLPSGETVQHQPEPLATNHILRLLYVEHKAILATLASLEQEVQLIRKAGFRNPDADQLARIRAIADRLMQAEPHHQREEAVLFPELEARGIYGPTHVMRAEHVGLRQFKHELHDLAAGTKPDTGEQICVIGSALVNELRMHIHKEN